MSPKNEKWKLLENHLKNLQCVGLQTRFSDVHLGLILESQVCKCDLGSGTESRLLMKLQVTPHETLSVVPRCCSALTQTPSWSHRDAPPSLHSLLLSHRLAPAPLALAPPNATFRPSLLGFLKIVCGFLPQSLH